MEVSETKKQNKYAALITYVIAVVFLLAGLFVPLFNGTGMLAMNLPDVFNHIIGSDVIAVSEKLNLEFSVNLFGTGTVVDVMAYVLLLYTFITLLSLLAFIPIIIAFVKNKGEVISVFAYIMEVAAVLILSVYLFTALQLMPESALSYNMLIALGGSLISLVVLSFINKGAAAALKLLLFILSAAGALTLFNYAAILPELEGLGDSIKLYPSLYSYEGVNSSGISFLSALFGYGAESTYGETLAALTEAKFKAAYVLATIAGLAVMINYFIDVIGLTTNAKRTGLLFNVVRYGIEFLAVVCLIITVLASSFNMGLFLVILAVVSLIRIGISVLRFVLAIKHAKEEKEKQVESEQTIRFAKPAKAPRIAESAETDAIDIPEQPAFIGAEPIEIDEHPISTGEQMAFIEPAPEPAHEEIREEVHLIEHPGEVQMQMPEDELPPIEEEEEEIPTVHALEQLEEYDDYGTEDYEDEDIPTVQSVTEEDDEPEEEPLEPLIPLQPLEPLQPIGSTDDYMIPLLQPLAPLEPLQPVEPVEVEPVQPVEPVEVEPEQPVEPVRAEPEQSVEPVRTEPEQPVKPVRTEPVQPVEPVRTEPVQPVEPVRTEPVQPVEPVRAEPVQKPAEHPFTIVDDGKAVYTIRYGGPSDEFINKLTNDEKIEFAMTFIEKGKGDIGNIPEYVIGGNNKKFFSAVFIYLGRVRGMISDGLLNKMFKELNMM